MSATGWHDLSRLRDVFLTSFLLFSTRASPLSSSNSSALPCFFRIPCCSLRLPHTGGIQWTDPQHSQSRKCERKRFSPVRIFSHLLWLPFVVTSTVASDRTRALVRTARIVRPLSLGAPGPQSCAVGCQTPVASFGWRQGVPPTMTS